MKKSFPVIFLIILAAVFEITLTSKQPVAEPVQINPASEINCTCKSSFPVKIKNLKTDFGAKGNNRHDDSWSYLWAAEWLSKNCSDSFILKLEIPAGTYLVGVQLAPGEIINNPLYPAQSFENNIRLTRKGLTLFELINAKNIIIEGTPKTIIKFKSGLYFGGFNKNLQP